MSDPVTRRDFLETTGMAFAGATVLGAGMSGCASAGGDRAAAAAVAANRRLIGSNDTINVALIGCGGMGRFNLTFFLDDGKCNAVAVCDLDEERLDLACEVVEQRGGQRPARYKNYREVLDRQDIDAVIIATPDHWHAIPVLEAIAAGKDVYCEKPASHNIREGRLMIDAACKYKAVVQVGTQQRSAQHMQDARDFIRSGQLGEISMTETYTYGNDAPDGMGHAPDEPAPAGIDYDMWLGPAPARPFNPRRFHHNWRWYFDYAAGMVGDWNVHLQDITMWTLKTPHAKAVSASGGKFVLTDDRDTPDTMLATYEFDSGPYTPNGYVHIYTMRKASGPPWHAGGYGMVFYGSKGKLHLDRNGWEVIGDAIDWRDPDAGRLVPNAKHGGERHHERHVLNFLECMRTRQTPIASIEDHHNIVTACHLANVSLRAGRKVFWDHQKELCFKDEELRIPDPKANQYLARDYRTGYELPKV